MMVTKGKAYSFLMGIMGLLWLNGWLEFLSFEIKMILITFGLLVASVLMVKYREEDKEKTRMIEVLRDVEEGNLNRRLLTKSKGKTGKVIFLINDLIDKLQNLEVSSRRTEQKRKELISNISHDIRTPLTSIIGYVEALKAGTIQDEIEQRAYIDIIAQKSLGLKALIDDIFHLAKLDANEITLNEERIEINELLRTIVIDFLPRLNREDIALKLLVPEEDYWVYGDKNSLVRIINNIIANAIHHGKSGKLLGLEVSQIKSMYVIVIWDKGPGIPEKDFSRIFERSYKMDDTRNKTPTNSGLGLAIAKNLIERHNGRIEVESKSYEKTAFKVYLPISKDTPST